MEQAFYGVHGPKKSFVGCHATPCSTAPDHSKLLTVFCANIIITGRSLMQGQVHKDEKNWQLSQEFLLIARESYDELLMYRIAI